MHWLTPLLLAISAEDYRRLAPVVVHVLVFVASVFRGVWSWWKGRSVIRSQPAVVYIIIMTATPAILVVGQHVPGRG